MMKLMVYTVSHNANNKTLRQPDKLIVIASSDKEALKIVETQYGQGYEIDCSDTLSKGVLDETWYD